MFRRAFALFTLALAACSQAPSNDAERLDAAFGAASSQYAVPRPLLEAIGYSETHWWMRPGVASVDQGYGLMHLVDDGDTGPLARTGAQFERRTRDAGRERARGRDVGPAVPRGLGLGGREERLRRRDGPANAMWPLDGLRIAAGLPRSPEGVCDPAL